MANASEATLQRLNRKNKSPPKAPIKENPEVKEKTATNLDDTQMTDLPADDTMVSLNETAVEGEPR